MENDPQPRPGRNPDEGPSLGPQGIYRFGWSFYLWLAIAAVVWIGVRDGGFTTELFVTHAAQEGQAARDGQGSRVASRPDTGGSNERGWWRTESILSSLALDVGLGLGGGFVILLAWALVERSVTSAAALSRRLADMLRGLTLSEALVLAFLSSFAEELFFRGAVQGSWPGLPGFVFATALFALVHGGPGREFRWWSLFALVAGGVMGAWVLLRGNLTAAIVTHWTVNSIQLARIARSGSEPTDSAAP